ncbi:MAG: hypothetical protein GQ476_00085 [Candidatus Aminicenantes bacterium]|nr:hypothetical protein [Candidatus Aminicenantes bacterium]
MHLKKCLLIFFVFSIFSFNRSFSQISAYTDQDCLSCHGKPDISQITSAGKVRSIFVDPEEWSQDIHHKGSMVCVDCHTNANPYLHFREGFIDVDCARCHPEEEEEYQKNIHLTFATPSPNKELPLCYHCHTKHHILLHDDPSSSVHEDNVGETCSECHAEVMVKGIFKGSSLGKISGHRKGDLSEKFDMSMCLNCHYDDSAHGAKRPFKDFCSRCHDVRSRARSLLGPTHLDSIRWVKLNYMGGGFAILLFVGMGVFFGYKSRKTITGGIKTWYESMKIKEEAPEKEKTETEQVADDKEMGGQDQDEKDKDEKDIGDQDEGDHIKTDKDNNYKE